jgi:phospholipid/cholesterol/gamma-HCH transport system ATP-binding protein
MIMKTEQPKSINPNTVNTKADETVIEITNLMKSFDGVEILSDVNLNLYKGENLVVLGKSGSGKSVLIKCIVGLLQPDYGTINVFGENVVTVDRKGLSEIRKKVGFLFQSGALYDSMTVKQNLVFPLSRIKKGLTRKEVDEKVIEVLENVGLPDVSDKMPSELSGGMRKRISLARTIIVDPLVMLYDEPTTGLDPVTSDEISELINEVQEKYKTSSIIITHDIKCALKTATRIVMLNEGAVYWEGNVKEFESSTDPIIHSFFL